MIILSNSFTDKTDEGCLKVANSLVKRIKKAYPDVTVISYDRKCKYTDIYLPINKLLINGRLISILNKMKQSVLYIPYPAPTLTTSLRIWILSLFSRAGLKVMLVQCGKMNIIAKLLLKCSKADVIAISKQAFDFYRSIVGNKVRYLKTGVDTKKFVPVSSEKVKELKIKYGFDPEKPIVLHVGHMKYGRNISVLTEINKKYQVLLVVSTLTKDDQDKSLKEQLVNGSNIKIIDDYISNIEEIYQMSDVYFFPVQDSSNCIDVPLSCLEAASCNKPVVTTDYGEMMEFKGKEGFFFIESFEQNELNRVLDKALLSEVNTRKNVIGYDWENSISALI